MKPLAIDLFCGLGGWTEGLLTEGWDVVGFDIERHVYGEHRYPAQLVLQDVLTIHGSQFRDASLIVASPPCQQYSCTGLPFRQFAGLKPSNDLFNACFRIQAEAENAAGRRIPMVVENVRAAQKWVGRSSWNYGSFHLWGDVPALMPYGTHRKLPGNNGPGLWRDRRVQRQADACDDASRHFFDWPRGDKRKASSAMIARIPLALSRHIARVYHP